MNGLGDKGCKEVAKALATGALSQLRILELGWNELSAASAPVLAKLLMPRRTTGCDTTGPCVLPHLQKLGLGGNGLGSQGAQALVVAALSLPMRALDLDLSMNHVGAQPLESLAEWAEEHACGADLQISISLEWNTIDDCKAVWRLVRALAASVHNGCIPRCVFIRLANNELNDLEPAEVLVESRGLVSC